MSAIYVYSNASTPNLKYLTVDQTIRDISLLIGHVKEKLSSPNARVVLWGTGYGAALATWTKQKYPHLIAGVWSSSGVYKTVVYTSGNRARIQLNLFRIKVQLTFER